MKFQWLHERLDFVSPKHTGNFMKPIETIYNGFRFRSWLEARWAVFFDSLGVTYEYEKDGYDLGSAGWYLPGFWLAHWPDTDINDGVTEVFVEVKPAMATSEEYGKVLALAKQTEQNAFIMQGEPYINKYNVTQIQVWDMVALENPFVVENLQFQEQVETVQYPGFPAENRYSIGLTNGAVQAHGFVCKPLLFGMRKADLDAAYLAARQARFEYRK